MYESFAAGADAILLIVAALAPEQLHALHTQARELGLAALVEVHDERELDAALSVGAGIIGINNRDLKTLRVDTAPHLRAAAARRRPRARRRPNRASPLADQLDELERAGVDGVLIGEALMRSADVEAACRELAVR